jgi:Ni/Co efflux regulator RcnB
MRKAIAALTAVGLVLGATGAVAQPRRDRDHDGIPNARDPNPNNARNPGLRDRDRDGVPNAFDRRDGGNHRWARGERLDRRYLSQSYAVSDWRRHGWRAPPRGYGYYRTETGDVVLAAVATGVISSVIANALAR